MSMWESVIEVLEIMNQEEGNPSRAVGLVQTMESFSFVFIMKMMLQILHITNELSLILQMKDQNVVQAMSLIVEVRTCLITLRSEGWEPLFEETKAFCAANEISIPNMSDLTPQFGLSGKGGKIISLKIIIFVLISSMLQYMLLSQSWTTALMSDPWNC
jgi:hypothetical protein